MYKDHPHVNKFVPMESTCWINEFMLAVDKPDLRVKHPSHIGYRPKACTSTWWMYRVYSVLRFLYVIFWYYFSPFFFSTFQFFLPLYVLYRDGVLPEAFADDAD